jgi:hypothetical protein
MKRLLLIAGIILALTTNYIQAQSIGFSYFFPKYGYFSTPIAPVHINLPVSFGKYFQITPGISMNSIGGMSLSGLPDELNSDQALVGPFQSFSGTLVPTIVIPSKNVELEILGGVFGFASMNVRLMSGNFDRMYAEAYDYNIVNSNLSFDKQDFGWGYVFGAKLNIRIKDNIWGYIAGRYYIGSQGLALNGDIATANNSSDVVNSQVSFPDASIRYEGFEITIGGSMRKKK